MSICSLIVRIMINYVCDHWNNIQATMLPLPVRYPQTGQLARSIFACVPPVTGMINYRMGRANI
jgi:hypothetical protein